MFDSLGITLQVPTGIVAVGEKHAERTLCRVIIYYRKRIVIIIMLLSDGDGQCSLHIVNSRIFRSELLKLISTYSMFIVYL